MMFLNQMDSDPFLLLIGLLMGLLLALFSRLRFLELNGQASITLLQRRQALRLPPPLKDPKAARGEVCPEQALALVQTKFLVTRP